MIEEPEPLIDVVVTGRRREADRVVSLDLESPAGRPLPHWSPGAHIDVMLPDGGARQYSLCGAGGWKIAVLDVPDGRGGSRWLHEHVRERDVLRVRGPRNHFELVKAQRHILVAGGIGITPIIAMVRELQRTGADWRLVYGGGSRSSMAFLDELTALGALGDRVTAVPADECGLIDVPRVLGTPRFGTAVYCCGPEPLLKVTERTCRSWPPGTLHVERFAPRQADTSGDRPFEVVARRSGRTIEVGARTSVLRALGDHGISVPYSCGEGVCGTCETKVLEGEVEHRDAILTEEEREDNAVMMVCCSRARGNRLVLDV
jgi:ferredoxin-NADP reductase